MPAVVQSLGALADLEMGWSSSVFYGRLRLYDTHYYDYATLYRTQPNVRTCVDFLARNIAQLGLHVFRRVSETDRKRLREHPLAQLLGRPLPPEYKVTRYHLIQALMGDLGVYFNAFWLKVKPANGPKGLLRIPPSYVAVKGGLMPTRYEVTIGGKLLKVAPEGMVHFRGYNAESAILGLSPLETLRRVLAEEHAAGDYREAFWQNAARMGGIIERPVEAPMWGKPARERFKAEFEALYSGGDNSGKTAILEEGMVWKQNTFNAQESEYLTGRRLTREECARAYHIPLPMVGILEHATFCLPGHVAVFASGGPKPIAEVQAGDQVWSHIGDGFCLKRVMRSGQTGIDPILRIKTQNRTLEANPTHPVLVRRLVKVKGTPDPDAGAKIRAGQSRWHYEVQHVYVPASEIKRGDILVALKELPEGTPRQSIPRMEFFGLLLGDGNVYPERGAVSIARANDAAYMDHYRQVMQQEFRSFGKHGNGSTREGLETQPVTLVEGDRQTRFASVLAAEELAKLGFSGTAHTKRVPGWVFGASRAERLALLRGYLDSDGSVDKRGKISYSSCNQKLIEDVRHLCMGLGIPVNNAYHRLGQTVLPTGDIGDVDQWIITCSDPEANRMIGSHDPRYHGRLAQGKGWDKKGKDYPFARGRRSEPPAGCEYSRVVSIEQLPPEPVFDLEIEGTHNFVAAGIVVHNSNIREQHKNLYQDSLGPWLAMIEQDIEMQLLPDFPDTKGVYVEFNIQEKLQGSFDEQTKALQSAVGRPWMTADEARARMNLPSMGGDAEVLVVPLNVLVGGQASPRDSAPPKTVVQAKAAEGQVDTAYLPLRERHEAKWVEVLSGHFRRQGAAIVSRIKAKQFIGEIWFDGDRWNEELGADLLRLNLLTAGAWGQRVATELETEIDEELMLPWLSENARIAAEEINATTRDGVANGLQSESGLWPTEEEPRSAIQHLFELALGVRAAEIARSKVTTAANFGSQEAARQGGLKTKTWQVNSANPREDHAALDGTTVGIGELFPNGMKWPGDPSGGAEQVANCQCSVSFGR